MCVEMNAIIQCLFFSSIRHNHVICWRNKKIDTYIQDMIDAYFQTETVDFCCDSCGCGQASATQTFKRLPRFGIILEHKHNVCCYEGVNKSKLIMMLCEGLREMLKGFIGANRFSYFGVGPINRLYSHLIYCLNHYFVERFPFLSWIYGNSDCPNIFFCFIIVCSINLLLSNPQKNTKGSITPW